MNKRMTIKQMTRKCFGKIITLDFMSSVHANKLARAARRFVRMEEREKAIRRQELYQIAKRNHDKVLKWKKNFESIKHTASPEELPEGFGDMD